MTYPEAHPDPAQEAERIRLEDERVRLEEERVEQEIEEAREREEIAAEIAAEHTAVSIQRMLEEHGDTDSPEYAEALRYRQVPGTLTPPNAAHLRARTYDEIRQPDGPDYTRAPAASSPQPPAVNYQEEEELRRRRRR
ncbi:MULTISPECIES: hypothetical protein [Micromonospora]|uniref:Uncharacterized protein n=1 Tax=Micromonospora yangpuensis TaxID=683228 RepID=A0A1C6UC19_9ACTN|nr:hypothetical protein [Micromonospora yangpuensis]GGM29640.1 hypothetical protein GCM10012279_55460 [Micromonospora yangpuensis]SCL51567.1 hypothetical protein GA0070617_1820 [Micromonospora yangpuensis]